jgi:regulator of replication initiation timing
LIKPENQSQEELIREARKVAQRLDGLKTEHIQVLGALQLNRTASESEGNSIIERTNAINKSLELLELGLGEAHVRLFLMFFFVLYTRFFFQ